jgi:gamma-glutamyltranspeptidase/glutathione hydrolase
MVVSAHPLASEAGIEILQKGGNAIDAAVAVQFALAVVYPNAGNIGGGGFLVYRSQKGETAALDYRETAPAKAHRSMYLGEKGDPITDKSLYGELAAGIPGTVAGMVEAHRKHGKLRWEEVIRPAIILAKKGFALTDKQIEELNNNRNYFTKYNPNGSPFVKDSIWKHGDILKQPDLAATLQLISKKGNKGFYRGKVAHLIVKQMQGSNGIISLADLKSYKSIWRKPVTGTYKNFKVISMPPPSSGGIALLTLMQAVEKYPLNSWGFQQDSTIQLIVEAERRVYADRAEYLGDPDFVKVPQKSLLDPNYIKQRMADIDFSHATPSEKIKPGDLAHYESEQTTHYCVVDKDRNAVSVTTTLNGSYGSKVFVAGAGFLLNNEMDDFSVKPGVPNQYGLVGAEANAIQPRKRMLSSMTPTILEKEGKFYMAVGSPGGSTIITSVFQALINHIEFGFDAQESVGMPRFHHQWLPDEIQAEDGAIPENTRGNLKTKGYEITSRKPYGRVEAIIQKADGTLEGGADPRGDDAARGY